MNKPLWILTIVTSIISFQTTKPMQPALKPSQEKAIFSDGQNTKELKIYLDKNGKIFYVDEKENIVYDVYLQVVPSCLKYSCVRQKRVYHLS